MVFAFPGESAADYLAQQGLSVVSDLPNAEPVAKYVRRRAGTSPLPASTAPLGGSAAVRFCAARVPPGASSIL